MNIKNAIEFIWNLTLCMVIPLKWVAKGTSRVWMVTDGYGKWRRGTPDDEFTNPY